MSAALAQHDTIVRGVITASGGAVFKHTGDGMAAVFDDPVHAVSAAADLQRAIDTAQWSIPGGVHVRAAVHSGAVHERDGDLFGPPLNRVARLLACCPAGGVLVSEATAALVSDRMPNGLGLADLGRIQLRDLTRSELVYGLEAEHLAPLEATVVAGATRAGAPRGWLPAIDDELVGRRDDLRRAVDALGAHRLVSLVGAGGMGKTRLAIEAATEVADRFTDGVWWCDLTAALSGDAVGAVVLAGLSARQLAGRTALASVTDHLASRSALVVLDNCEHVIDAVRELVTELRDTCPNLHLMTTSRESLGIRSEHLLTVSSLSADEAAQLFVARAREVRPELPMDDEAMAAVRDVCMSLDHIPLALELAAARCRSMSTAELAVRLKDRFRVLRGDRTRVERHRTLHAAVAWSYELLDNDERDVFDRMSVFAGGAMLDAVAAVTGRDELDVLDILDHLTARSMVVVVDTPLGTRYRELDTLRQFGEARLVEEGVLDRVRDAHLEWAVTLSGWLGRTFLSPDEVFAFRRYLAEIDNLRVAVSHAAATGRSEAAMDVMSGVLRWAWTRPSYEVLDWIDESLLANTDHTSSVRTGVFAELAKLALYAADTPRVERLLSSTPHMERTSSAIATAEELIWVEADVDRAEHLLGSALTSGPIEQWDLRVSLLHAAYTRWNRPSADVDAEAARRVVADGVALANDCRQAGGTISLAATLANLGDLHCALCQFDEALACTTEAARLAREPGAWLVVDMAQVGRAHALSRIQQAQPERRRDAVQQVRDILADAVTHRNYFFVSRLLNNAVDVTLWSVGAHHAALVVRRVNARLYPAWADRLPANAAQVVGPAAMAQIETEAASADLSAAAGVALRALDEALKGMPRDTAGCA